MRLDPDVIAQSKATAKGWSTGINEVLKRQRAGWRDSATTSGQHRLPIGSAAT
ncbi:MULTISPECIES: BrnA antitoxin family protein [Aminobacter]|uniref:BrnA antitoxin family protein n=1 Tax=Aminobacter TaxID=31988 RepID=UPI0032B1D47A